MPRLKRPELPEGPRKELNDALHDLHFRSGLPSVRELVARVGGEVAGKSRVHDAFSSERVPAWGLVELLVETLAEMAPGADQAREVQRIHQLWLAASGHTAPEQLAPLKLSEAKEPPPLRRPAPAARPDAVRRPVLAMRVEWVDPSELRVDVRRRLRVLVGQALDDIGWPSKGKHRRNGSAGSTIVLDSLDESPSLTVGTFLATLDNEVEYLREPTVYPTNFRTTELRFMALFDPAASDAAELLEELKAIWSSDDVGKIWGQSIGRVSALINGLAHFAGHLPGTWDHHVAEVNLAKGSQLVPFDVRTRYIDPHEEPF
ncbi:hypothetical protein [Streptomyces sp. ALI-76-A]|uniref:hypothetical protein n=1 Tax=Streptomyces sp. ALI-76-A TaxID=3025736 RepID=UPI00256F10FC|nr:hypothetical protein [Streptomyces sp. ALI-76-A]MDL5202780.1 hypothetical protein [Streptomyces sp. ALI-76-A]